MRIHHGPVAETSPAIALLRCRRSALIRLGGGMAAAAITATTMPAHGGGPRPRSLGQAGERARQEHADEQMDGKAADHDTPPRQGASMFGNY